MLPVLKTSVWASALLRRAEVGGAFAVVLKKGDPDAGSALVKVRTLDGQATAYRAMRDMNGARIWWPKGPDSEAVINHYIDARLEDDPDLWVLEVDDKGGRHFLTEAVEDPV